METCRVLNEWGNPTGQIVPRGSVLPSGSYYPVVHVWIRDESGLYLIQQRADHISLPGAWATTTGYILSGEDSLSAAIREVREELGLQLSPEQLRCWDRHLDGDRIEDLWLAQVRRSSIGTPIPGSEVKDWVWATKTVLAQRIRQGAFWGYSYFDQLPG